MEWIVVAFVAAGLWWRVEPLLRRRLDQRDKEISVKEAEVIRPAMQADEPMPAMLVQLAMQESEPWAREATMKAFRERYDLTRSWESVSHMAMANALKGESWGENS